MRTVARRCAESNRLPRLASRQWVRKYVLDTVVPRDRKRPVVRAAVRDDQLNLFLRVILSTHAFDAFIQVPSRR